MPHTYRFWFDICKSLGGDLINSKLYHYQNEIEWNFKLSNWYYSRG